MRNKPGRLECVGYLFLLIAGLGLAKNVIAPRSDNASATQGKAAADKRLPVTDLACRATVLHTDVARVVVQVGALLGVCQAVRVTFADGVTREYR